jgi:hypothetical protein
MATDNRKGNAVQRPRSGGSHMMPEGSGRTQPQHASWDPFFGLFVKPTSSHAHSREERNVFHDIWDGVSQAGLLFGGEPRRHHKISYSDHDVQNMIIRLDALMVTGGWDVKKSDRAVKAADQMILGLEEELDEQHTDLRKNPLNQNTAMLERKRINLFPPSGQRLISLVKKLCEARNKLAHAYKSHFLCISPWEVFEREESVRQRAIRPVSPPMGFRPEARAAPASLY